MTTCVLLTALMLGQADGLGPGDHLRALPSGGQKRSYYVHVPAKYDAAKPAPVVLALHGLAMNGKVMEYFSGLSQTADREGFVVVYPNGTGPGNLLLAWNAGAFPGDDGKGRPDDVAFLGRVLDDVEKVLNVDKKRVFVTGMSNGAMMSYRLASAMPRRIAAIAPVAGTMPAKLCDPKCGVPVIHFHGTADTLVPYAGLNKEAKKHLLFCSVPATINAWAEANAAGAEPDVTELPSSADKLKVRRTEYRACKCGADVVLVTIDGGGHTWPGMNNHAAFLGASTRNVSANDAMWEFFRNHPKK